MKTLCMILILVISLLCFVSSADAQLGIDWEYAFNENFTPKSSANSLDLTSDHRLTVVGYEYSGYFDYRFLAFKLDLDGNYVSHVNHSSISIGSHVEEDSNGNFILLTNPNTNNGALRYMNENYQFKWLRFFDGYVGESHSAGAHNIVVPIVNDNSDPELYLLDRWGQTVWSITIEYPDFFDSNADVAVTADSGFIIATGHFATELVIMKINHQGGQEWITNYIFSDAHTPSPANIDYLVDGGFIISGYIENNDNRIGVVRFDNEGQFMFMSEGLYGQSLEMGDGSIINVEKTDPDVSRIYWYNASGQTIGIFDYEFDNPPVFQQRMIDVEITGDSSFAVCGRCGNEHFNRLSAFVTHFTLPPTEVEINIEAYRQPLFIRRQGVFYWYGEVRNNTASPMTRDVWVQARKPDGSLSGALALWSDLEIPANGQITATVRQGVPLDAPLGEYNYIVRVGDYPNPQFQHHFALTVVDGQPSGPGVNTDLSPPDFVPDRPLKPTDFSLDISPETWNGE